MSVEYWAEHVFGYWAVEREGRVIDHDAAASMEKKKQEGYF